MPPDYQGEPYTPPSIGGDGSLSDEDRKLFEAMRRAMAEGLLPQIGIGGAMGKAKKAPGLKKKQGVGEAARKAAGAGAAAAGLKKAKPKPKLPKHWRNKPFI